MHSYMISLRPGKWSKKSPAVQIQAIKVSKCEAKSHRTISGRTQVLCGQFRANLQLPNALCGSLSSLQGVRGEPTEIVPLAQERPLPPLSSLRFTTFSPVLHCCVQLNEKLKDMKQEKESCIVWLCLYFLQQAACSSLQFTLVFGKTRRYLSDGKRQQNMTVSKLSYGDQTPKMPFMEGLFL